MGDDELVQLVRDVHGGIANLAKRQSDLDRRMRRFERDDVHGYVPGDQAPGDGYAPPRPAGDESGLTLGPRDSLASWALRRGVGPTPPSGQFSLGRLVQGMLGGDRSQLTDVERWAQTEGSDAQGGVIVPEAVAATVLDVVRARSVVAPLVTVAPMTSDTMVWPAIVSNEPGPAWKDELEKMDETQLTFGSKTLDSKTLRCTVVLSEELSEDMTPQGAAAIERELNAAFALEVDKAILYGAGGKAPLGIKNTPDVTVFPPAAGGFAYSDIGAAITAIRAANHEPSAAVLSAAAAGMLDALVATDSGQPLQPSPAVAALPSYVTNVVDAPGPSAGDIFVGEFKQAILGVRPSLGVRIKPVEARLADDFAVALVCWLRCDVMLQDPKAFAIVSEA